MSSDVGPPAAGAIRPTANIGLGSSPATGRGSGSGAVIPPAPRPGRQLAVAAPEGVTGGPSTRRPGHIGGSLGDSRLGQIARLKAGGKCSSVGRTARGPFRRRNFEKSGNSVSGKDRPERLSL